MRPADEPTEAPLADDELDALFAPLADARLIALAVSGGADSLALLDAIDRWRKHGPPVLVLTVDHRLRKGSRAEAKAVAAIAERRGMEARILTWKGARPESDIESAARAERYRLLIEECRIAGATHLVLAHHQDDVAETFLLRLRRGSGVFGLAAMRPLLDLGDVVIARPFLTVSHARLVATTAAAGLVPIEDPMNADPRFSRARARLLLPRLAELGLDPASLAASARRLADAADAIDEAATMLLGEAVEADDLAVAWLDPVRFAAAPHAVRLRALARLLIAIGGGDYQPRYERLAALHDVIVAQPPRLKRTLAGAVVEVRAGRVAFYREGGRQPPPTILLKAGFRGTWDHRFSVEVAKGAPAGLSLGPLGSDARQHPGRSGRRLPVEALAVLPALRQRGRTVASAPFSSGFPPVLATFVTIRPILGEQLRRPPLFPYGDGR